MISVQKKEKVVLRIIQPILWYSLLVCLSIISMLWSINRVRTVIELIQLICYGQVFVMISNLDEENKYKVERIVLIVGTGIALLGISEYVFAQSIRIQSTFTNANPFGIYIAMLYLVAWDYYLRRPSRMLSIMSVILLIALILTGSRGSFISLFLGIRVK